MDERDTVGKILRRQLLRTSDPEFAAITLDLFDHLSNAISDLRLRGAIGWSQPILEEAIGLEWIWRLATRGIFQPPAKGSDPIAFDNFRDDVIGGLRWYLRGLTEGHTDLACPLENHPGLEQLRLRHSVFALPIAQALMRSSERGQTVLDQLRVVAGTGERLVVH